MIHADAIEDAVVEPLENAPMGGIEDIGTLDAQTDQRVDIEEPAIAKFLIGGAPIGQSIVLQVENFVERIVIVDSNRRLLAQWRLRSLAAPAQ